MWRRSLTRVRTGSDRAHERLPPPALSVHTFRLQPNTKEKRMNPSVSIRVNPWLIVDYAAALFPEVMSCTVEFSTVRVLMSGSPVSSGTSFWAISWNNVWS